MIKHFKKRSYPPGQHGMAKKRRKKSECSVNGEAKKAKYSWVLGSLRERFIQSISY
jgi:small subunit ribosomal protein S4